MKGSRGGRFGVRVDRDCHDPKRTAISTDSPLWADKEMRERVGKGNRYLTARPKAVTKDSGSID
jgi:hypothetical protein